MSTALVLTTPAVEESNPSHAGSRPNADFVAQLIATSGQAPQTRVRRRAAPQEATAAYGAVGQWPTPLGHAVSRSL